MAMYVSFVNGVESVAPSGARFKRGRLPTADAVGYLLSVLRT